MNKETADVRSETQDVKRQTAEGRSIRNVAVDFAYTGGGTVVAMLDLDGDDMLIRQQDPTHSVKDLVQFQFGMLGALITETRIRVYHDAALFWQEDEVQALARKHDLELVPEPMGQPVQWAGKMERLLNDEMN